MPKREDERWSTEKDEELRCCPACNRYGRYYYNKKLGCWICGWCEKSFPVSRAERQRTRLRIPAGRLPLILAIAAIAIIAVLLALRMSG